MRLRRCECSAFRKGRYRSGQTGQTVNLLALRLRWFESSPAQIFTCAEHRFLAGCGRTLPSVQAGKSAEDSGLYGTCTGLRVTCLSGLFAGHLRGAHRTRRHRRTRVPHRRRAPAVLADAPHLRLKAGLRSSGH
jgi:hypothetical protein